MAALNIKWMQQTVQFANAIEGNTEHESIYSRWTHSQIMKPTMVWPTHNAVYEAACSAGRGDTTRSYGFVTDHSVSCGWKPLRVKGSFGSFDSATGGVHAILEGAFVKTDPEGIMWQRTFTLVIHVATCDASCGGLYTETIHFTDFPMLFGSHQQASPPMKTDSCNRAQQVPPMTVERSALGLDAADAAGKATPLPAPIVLTPCRPLRPGQVRPAPAPEAPASAHNMPKKPACVVITPCRAPRQTPEEPAATVTLQISMDERSDSEVPAVRVTLQVNEVKRSEEPAGSAEPQVCEEEEALGAATGSPVAAVPATEDLQPQQSELNANSSSSDKCSLADTLDQPGETEAQSSDDNGTLATGARRQSPTSVLRSTPRARSRRRRRHYKPLAEFEAAAEKAAIEKALATRAIPSPPPSLNETFAAIVKGGPRASAWKHVKSAAKAVSR